MEDGSVVPAQAIFVRFMSKFTTAMKEFQDYRGLKNCWRKADQEYSRRCQERYQTATTLPFSKAAHANYANCRW